MFDVSQIASIPEEILETLVCKNADAFADLTADDEINALEVIDQLFVDYVTIGEGSFEEFRSWRQAWKAFVESRREELADQDDEEAFAAEAPATRELRSEIIMPTVPAAVLTKEHQMALF